MRIASDLVSRPQRIVVLFTSSTLRFLHRPATTDMQKTLPVMPDDHSKLVPPLPIPNRTVKRFRADDSAATSVKVGYRQACYSRYPRQLTLAGIFAFYFVIYCPRYLRCLRY